MAQKTNNAKPTTQRPRMVKWLWIIAMFPFALLFFLLVLTALGLFGKLPSFEELENPKSNIATEIYSEDGKVIGSFFVQNRSYVEYAELFPEDSTQLLRLDGEEVPAVVAALISTEDERFHSHSGIDIKALIRVGVKTIALGNSGQGGGSTITQQVAKNLFPRDTTSVGPVMRKMRLVISKLKEWITAVKLEYNYTKEELVAMYLNTVEYGSNAYGIKSAARTFFNKTPDQLNVQEAAVLVGVVNKPTRYNPVLNYDHSIARRNTVMSRMRANGCITREQYDSLSALPIQLNYRPISHNDGTATYFREMLRLVMNQPRPKRSQFNNDWDFDQALDQWNNNPLYGWCQKNQKADGTNYNIYRDGLKIYTTINSSMQKYAEEALLEHMTSDVQPRMDRQVKNTGVLFRNQSKEDIERILRNAMRYSDRYYQMNKAGVPEEEIYASFERPCRMKIFTYKGDRDTTMTPRDSILHHKQILRASFVAMDPTTGHVKAYVGGPNFRYFKYDLAKQGKRQIGSTIKPFIYTFAIDHLGLTPCTQVMNEPVTIETDNGTPWTPKEANRDPYDSKLHTLSWGLANSRNNYSAWIMKQSKQPAAVADFIHNMGIDSYIDPQWALCLGSSEASLFELTGAFCTFANRGVHTDPIFVTRIEDRQGNLLATFIPPTEDAISEQTAYTMLGMLQNVVRAGTAGRLRWAYNVTGEVGGKTGTSNENRDAWFVGVTPNLVAGAWCGGEDQSVHISGAGEGGAALALPIFGRFITKVYADPRLGVKPTDTFSRPNNVVVYDCDEENRAQQAEAAAEDEFFD